MKFSLKDIVQAFRKAKADMWYRHDLNEDDYFVFENDWENNIRRFQAFMDRSIDEVIYTEDWLGGWRLSAKKTHFKEVDSLRNRMVTSDPAESCLREDIQSMSYRLMAKPSVNFQILGSLWINKVGWKYENVLGKCVYGNRLRPLKDGKPNPSTQGSFQFYRRMFTKWKQEGIDCLKETLKHSSALVMTGDIKSYFHCLKPDFLLNARFLKANYISLSSSDRELTKHLIKAIHAWSAHTPLHTGLPVGFVASGVIANLALAEFDRCLDGLPDKVFYGRYVDDILIVFRNQKRPASPDNVWRKIADTSNILSIVELEDKDDGRVHVQGIDFTPPYIQECTNSQIRFCGKKCRFFFLDRTTGASFIETLSEQIKTITSEFRYLPKTIFNKDEIENKVQRLVAEEGESADNFRKIDALVLRRRELKEILREMRFFYRNLPSACWKDQRLSFYKVIKKHLTTYARFPEYAENEFRQVLSVATICGDFDALFDLLTDFEKRIQSILKITPSYIASPSDDQIDTVTIKSKWRDELFLIYARCIKCALNPNGSKEYSRAYFKFVQKTKHLFDRGLPVGHLANIMVSRYAFHDLANNGLIQCLQWENVRPHDISCDVKAGIRYGGMVGDDGIDEYFGVDFIKRARQLSCHVLAPWCVPKGRIPLGIIFPTRPIGEMDIPFIGNGLTFEQSAEIFRTFRGYDLRLVESEQVSHGLEPPVEVCKVPGRFWEKPRVALLNLETKENMCCDEIEMPEEKGYFERFRSIITSFNAILSHKNVNYILIHELALPLRWFVSLANRCSENGISLISGTTYRVTDKVKKLCKNEVWLSLVSDIRGFKRPVIACEEKQRFAHEEAYELKKIGYTQDMRLPISRHRVFRHGDFSFSTLICSELTDITNRARLVGFVDALFILAWNKDTSSFAPIIESSALDLHAYVVQANNNVYGDSRIRAPERDSWRRDVVRIRGGIGEFWVLGELDIAELRKFQQNWNPDEYYKIVRNEAKEVIRDKCRFKPLPIGYAERIQNYRKSER